jgi:uncharacterized protein (TIGR03546 family)
MYPSSLPYRLDRMLTILKLIQSLVKTLHSEGTPGQVAAGVALGAALGLTPLMSLHNLAIIALLLCLNVSFGAGLLGWALFAPAGFLMDPIFDRIGHALLLETPGLAPVWTAAYNTPVLPYTSFNNTVVLGSFVGWLALSLPIYALARVGVVRYRATIGARVRQSKLYHTVVASRAYNVYRWFRPE